ncbi:MAG: winged helix-turn-helix domain-containing protein [Gammaproteobacteria bacterium]|nr:winged helix-turn-helix domain-containing protein [Gammaproteobacteria bacterium]
MIYRFDEFAVDTLRAEVRLAGKTVPLRRQSFDVLVHLLQRPHRIVSKEELLNAVWGNKVVTDGALKHCLMEIRAAIGDCERKVVRTVARRGYILEARVTKQSVAADDGVSILVAPITDQSADVNGDYIADGLTEEIIAELSKVRSLRVIARASAMRLKGAGDAVQDEAKKLGVDFVVHGSVRKWGDKLRVILQLSRPGSDAVRWSEHYNGTLGDLFELQDEIARSVAEELAIRLGVPEPTNGDEFEDPRAIEPYLRARYETLRFSREGLQQAERHLINGLDLVGPNARLLSALGHAYAKYSELGLDPTGAFIAKAAECAEKIFELDPHSSSGYLLLGMVRFFSGELRAARALLERSLDANPANSADPDALATLGYSYALSGQNRRALQLFDELLDVDPLTPMNHCMPGFVAIMEGRFADAISPYRRFMKLDPQNPFAIWTWSYVMLRNGRVDEAAEAVRNLKTQHANSALAQLGAALFHGVCGEPEAAREAVTDELRAAAMNTELISRELTHCHALVGETEEALSWLENTVRIGNINYPFWSQHNEWVDSIRGNSRFDAIMRDVEQEWMSVTFTS